MLAQALGATWGSLRQYLHADSSVTLGSRSSQLLFNGVAVVVTKAKGLIMIVVLGHVLGVSGLGVWVQIYVLNSLLSIIAGLGLFNAVVRFYPRELNDGRRRLSWTALVLVTTTGLLLGLAAFSSAPWSAQVLTDDRNVNAFRLGAALVPLMAVRLLLLNISRAEGRLSLFSGSTIASDSLELSLVIAGLAITNSATGAIGGSVAALILGCIGLFYVSRRAFGRPCRLGGGRRYLAYSLPIVPMQLSDEALARGDRLIVGAFMGPAAAGIYSALYALASVINITNVPITNVVFPKIVQVGAGASRRLLASLSLLFSAFGIVQVVVLALLAGWASGVLLGDGQPWMRSFAVVALAGGGVVFLGVGRILSLQLFREGRTVTALGIWGGAAIVNALLLLPLVPMYGIVGAAAASFIAYGLFLFLQINVFAGRGLWMGRRAGAAQASVRLEAGVPE